MQKYEDMYSTLFNKMTDIVNQIQEIQQVIEEMYIQGDAREQFNNKTTSNDKDV